MRTKVLRKLGIFILIFLWFVSGWPAIWDNPKVPPGIQRAYAGSVTAATGGSTISADTNTTDGVAVWSSLTGPVIIEAAVGEVGTGTVILSVPSGFVFDTTASSVTLTVTNGTCSGGGAKPIKLGTGAGASTETVTPTTTTITNNIKQSSAVASGCAGTLTYTGIKVRPTAGTPLASGNITKSSSSTSTIIGVTNGSTNFGTLTEVAGSKKKLTITTQPSSTATVNTDFATKPIVELQDGYNNTIATDSATTITEVVVLSTQTCGGTAGSGTLSSTPTSGNAVSSGVMTYTAMQYSVVESIKICFSSASVASALSGAINVINLPIVSTQATTNVKDITATANGTISAINGENTDKQGFVYDNSTKSLPGNVAPGSSGYASYTENTGSVGAVPFTVNLTSLSGGVTYYGRAFAHNSAGYSYGGEVSFTTAVISISITSSGTISYGLVAPSASKDTTSGGTQSAQNGSTIAENFNIKTSNATGGTQWTIGSSAGANIFVHEFSTNGGGAWTKFTAADSYQTLATGVAASGTQNFDLRITAPSSTTDYQQKSITITIQAVGQ